MMNQTELYNEVVLQLQNEIHIDIASLPREHREDLKSAFGHLASTRFTGADPSVLARIEHEIFGCGPLEVLLGDAGITEILINGPNSIWVERDGQLERFGDQFISRVSYHNFLQRLQTEARVQANLNRPFADGYWRDFRLHLIIPPLATGEPHLSLRRHPKSPWTLSALELAQWAPSSAIQKIRQIIEAKSSFLVIGGTSSGKTSVLNACLQEIATDERVVCIEDTSEIQLPNHASTKLLSRIDLNGLLRDVDLAELLRQSLRMRPDRIIIGEVRGNEARDLLMAFSTGHRGGMGSLHAENPRQGLMRLEMLVQMGAPQWSLRAIRHLIFFGIQYIINVVKAPEGRRLEGIYKLSSLEEHGFCLETIYQAITSSR